MSTPRDKVRPEAGKDTQSGRQGEGAHARDGDSGGHRSPAGSTYGDFVPDKGQPRKNDDRDANQANPAAGEYYTGGGNIDRLANEPAARKPTADAGDEERIAEDNRNKSFDTTHVHKGTTTRKI
jgi:hypothetical protein